MTDPAGSDQSGSARPTPPVAAPPVTLVTGAEELLVERAVAAVVERARLADPTADVRQLAGSDLDPSELNALTSPSLFGETTVLVVQTAEELQAEAAVAIADLVRDPPEQVLLVIVHAGTANRAKAVLEACRSTRVPEVTCGKVTKVAERVEFVRGEARARGRQLGEDAARSLVDAVGSDLRELAAACAQLVADAEGQITPDVVTRYYSGRAEVSSFQVADLAVEGRTSQALAQLRWALGSGVAPVLVTAALAQALRSIGRVASAPRGARSGDLARDLGLPPWKVDLVRRQVRGWTADGLASAIIAVAEADGQVKGVNGVTDPGYALERAVVLIGQARAG
jgi:DNA polymerase III subunit delta